MGKISQKEIEEYLGFKGEDFDFLVETAGKVRDKEVGNKVYLRGIVEITNKCIKNCYYCGIRKGNIGISRYFLEEKDAIDCVRFAVSQNLTSIVLQGGELKDKDFVFYVEKLVKRIKEINPSIAITLSFGEQDFETYKRWYDAGAERYLLRIETSDKKLYEKWHPESHSFEQRMKCLEMIKKVGYQTGTGVLIGAPMQTISHLASDIVFFKEFDIDMLGMGPYVIHPQTPFGKIYGDWFEKNRKNIFDLAIKMIAAARIVLKDVNIASTTALDSLNPEGRVYGLKAGANVIMPDITPMAYKRNYLLYKDKAGLYSSSAESLFSVLEIVKKSGLVASLGEVGTSPHFLKKRKNRF